MMKDYLCIIDKVTAKSITVEVANTERPFNVEWKDNLIMSVKIKCTDTAYEFCNYVMEHGHKTNVINGSGDTFENLIMTEVIMIADPQGYLYKDKLEIKFTPARENENTNKNKEGTTMKSEEYLTEVNKLKKKIERLNERCKGIVLDDDDYEVIMESLNRLGQTLARNKITYLQRRYTDVLDKLNTMVRRIHK